LAPARAAKAASERSRPACDQLTSTWAALIGPTPDSSSSHGATAATTAPAPPVARPPRRPAAGSGGRCSAGSGRSCGAPATGSAAPAAPRSARSVAWSQARAARPVAPRAPHNQGLELVDGAHLGPAGAVASGQQHPQRLPITTPTRHDLVVVGQGLPRRPESVRASLLAPVRPAGRLGRPTSTTHSPRACKKLVSPAP
jgi:hypothetical protein